MQIDIEQLDNLIEDSDKILIRPEGEEILLKLLDIQDQVEAAMTEAKKKLEEAALRINPNFKSISSDKIKVFYREYGTRYTVDESLVPQMNPKLFEKEIKYKAIPKEVDAWTKENDGMPLGIIEKERTKSLSFSRKDTIPNETY